jgi:hypothetical protein
MKVIVEIDAAELLQLLRLILLTPFGVKAPTAGDAETEHQRAAAWRLSAAAVLPSVLRGRSIKRDLGACVSVRFAGFRIHKLALLLARQRPWADRSCRIPHQRPVRWLKAWPKPNLIRQDTFPII